MKKIIALFLACIMAFAFVACGSKGDTDDETQTAAAEVSDDTTVEITEEATATQTEATTETVPQLTDVQAVELYNKAYTVARDWFSFYSPYCIKGDYFTDETDGMKIYYAIGHDTVNSIDTLKALLYEYFSVRYTDSMVDESYIEKDSRLYQQCLMAGDLLPTYYLDETEAIFVASSDEKTSFEITVTGRYPEAALDEAGTETYKTRIVDFVYENGNWVIDNSFERGLYPQYVWNGVSSLEQAE